MKQLKSHTKLKNPLFFLVIYYLLFSISSTNCFSQEFDPPQTIVDLSDGTAHDIAAGYDFLFLAQGRNVSIIDPQSGERISDFKGSPFNSAVVAVEFQKSSGNISFSTKNIFHFYDAIEVHKTWESNEETNILDLKFIPGSDNILVVCQDKCIILNYSGSTIQEISEFSIPEGISFFQRIHHIVETSHGTMAYLSGGLSDASKRGMHGLIIANLDKENWNSNPITYDIWDPVGHYSSTQAAVNDVKVVDGYDGDKTYAFIACGKAGQLTVLDVTDPANIKNISKIDIASDFPVFKVLLNDKGTILYIASANILHKMSLQDLSITGSANVGFYSAGDHDMAFFKKDGKDYVWTATHFSVDYVIHSVDVTGDKPKKDVSAWWISSSDGGIAVPEWNSIYLPTFGGVVRYDVSDETNPVAVDESYQPAKGTVEHIDVIFPDPTNKDNGFLLTAPGNGGVQYWAVSKDNPNPAAPLKVVEFPSGWEGNPVYQNDVTFYQKDGVNYFLSDLANRKTQDVALQIYNTQNRKWLNAIESSPDLTANSKSIVVSGDYAFVTCSGGFFVVDLSGLPESAQVVAEVINDWNNDSKADDTDALCVSPDGKYVYIAADPGVIQSFKFNQSTNEVTGPLCVLTGDSISGSTSRARYYDAIDRFYIAGRGGNLMEIDAEDPYNLILRSVWNNGSYTGEMQDCHIYDFGNGPRILAVKNNECFAILDPDDGNSEPDLTPVRVNRIFPENGSEVEGTNVKFLWNQSTPNVEAYWLQIAINRNVFFTDSTITDTTFLYNKLSLDVEYSWRVMAKNSSGWNAFDDLWTFTPKKNVAVLDGKIQFTGFSVRPNPASEYIEISLNKGASSIASGMHISIYNSLGQKVIAPTLTVHKGEGIKVDVTGFPNGVYTIVISGNNGFKPFVRTQKFAVVK